LATKGRAKPIVYHFFPPIIEQDRLLGHFHLSCTFNNRRLLLGRLGLLLLLSGPTECGAERLRPDAQPTRLLDDRLVYRQCRAVDLDDILQNDGQSKKGLHEKEGGGGGGCLFKVNLGIGRHPSVADEVHDPFLAFIRRKVETGRKVALQKKRVNYLSLRLCE
jgi:hypothetical protein